MGCALVELTGRQLGQGSNEKMHGVVDTVGVRDVSLGALERESGVYAAAAAVLDHLADPARVRCFSDNAKIGDVAVLGHPLQYSHRPARRGTFFVARDEQAD